MEFNFETVRLNRLACRMKKGDKRAAAALYDELAPRVFGFCLSRTGARHVAEDLTQDIFLKLLDRIGTFDDKKGSFPVWFWRSVRNHLIDHYRSKKVSPFADLAEEEIQRIASAEKLADDTKNRLELERFKGFIKTLGDDEKNVFELRYVAELSYKEMAEIMERSEGALRVVASRLKQKIKNNLVD